MEKHNYIWEKVKKPNPKSILRFGYRTCLDDPLMQEVDPVMQPILEEAMDYIHAGQSYRDVGNWIEHKTGKFINHNTVKKMFERVVGRKMVTPYTRKKRATERARKPKTPEERKQYIAEQKVRYAKSALTRHTNNLERVKEESTSPSNPAPVVDGVVPAAPQPHVLFKPNPGPQETFLAASEQEVLYGGAAGGGKSFALIADPMRYYDNPKFNGLILRRTNDELRELKWKSKELYPQAFPKAEWKEKDSLWIFPSGAQMWITYLDRDDDVHRYQGQAFSYIAFDELTHWPTPFPWEYMRTRLRTVANLTDPSNNLPLFMRATTNPGGPGHGWVKKMFIDPAPAGQAFHATDIQTGKVLTWPDGRPLFQRRFIPAKLSDNPYLALDGQYEANLLSQSSDKKRQLLEGDWSVADGAAFIEFRSNVHTMPKFDIPKEWVKFRACDFGYSSHSAVLWFTIDPAYDTLLVYRELYTSKVTAIELAKLILEAERGERIQYGMLDSSCWHQRGQTGPSIAEEMLKVGTSWRPADRSSGSRTNGKNRIHELLKVDDFSNKPGLIIFDNCRQLIADLPVLPSHPDGLDDIDERYPDDHTYDALRYGVMSRPRATSPFEFNMMPIRPSYQPANKHFGY